MTLDEWINYKPVTKEEDVILFPSDELIKSQHADKTIVSKFLDILSPNINLKIDYDLDLDPKGATQLIQRLIEYYFNKNATFIVSDFEHPAVKTEIEKHKERFIKINDFGKILSNDQTLISDLSQKISKINSEIIVVYIIGMQNAFMIQTPNQFYIDLKIALENKGKKVILVIDAVQELLLSDRDYRIFDYIIGTAHSTISNYNLGFLIRKKDNKSFDSGLDLYDNLSIFLKQLDILFKRSDKIFSFRHVFGSYFQENCPIKYRELDTVNYNLTIEIPYSISFDEYHYFDNIMSRNYDIAIAPFQSFTLIRLRAPSLVLGVNFNNNKRTLENLSIKEGLKKLFQLLLLIQDR